jgi:hypothetical protein
MPGEAAPRRVELHRRVAIIRPDVIDVRPSRAALLKPLVWFLIGAGAFAGIALGLERLPVPVLVALLIIAVVTIPSAGLGVVYGLFGSHVVFDRTKQSATWQQGLIGLGIGTQELVPFWKIAAIVVEEAGASPESGGAPVEELAQWQIVLEKTNGRRLVVGGATAPRLLAGQALAAVREVAEAIAALTGAPLRMPGSNLGGQGAAEGSGQPPARRRARARSTPTQRRM